MITLHDVHKGFNQGYSNEYWALRGINLRLAPQQVTVFQGPSGSGKTTLLTLVGGLARPSQGRIYLEQQEITSLPERFLTQIRRQTFGFVFQQFHLIRGLSALENVMLPAYPLGLPYPELRARAEQQLEQLQLGHRARTTVEWLSGGEQQRVAIARALINNPKVLIADEPTANLDTQLSQQFLAILEQLVAEGRTIILTSHDPRVVHASVVNRVVTLADGKIVEPGDG
jgi:putative ABC transport system ATP-binding protein